MLTDPPYEIGFMGKKWDASGIAFNIEVWGHCLRVLKPGGHLLAFGGTRTYHRMAVAIEDAGFEIRDMIEWVYGSGFPKSLNIGKAVDKLAVGKEVNITKGTSEWEGWGTALKPAHEPICVARKPLSEKTVAENCLKWGTGGINIDESRVDFVSEEDKKESTTKNQHADFGTKPMINNNVYGDYSMIQPKNFNPSGRFPANLILSADEDGKVSEEVRECFPDANHKTGSSKGAGFQDSFVGGKADGGIELPRYNDSGNASRFFKSIIYQAKAGKKDRGSGNNHPTVKPIALLEYLINMVTPKGGTVLDPFLGSGTTAYCAKKLNRRCIGIEIEEKYCEIAANRCRQEVLELRRSKMPSWFERGKK